LARELAEKEEANLQLEEHFSSLQEEVEVKTKKLKKLWAKFQGAVREQQDLQEEFQTDRSDMLDTIRQLSRTVKLKDVVIHSFIPEDAAKVMERRAVWSAEEEAWTILKIELAGNNIRSAKFPSSFKKGDKSQPDFDRVVEGIAGRVDHTIGDDGEEISFIDSGIPNPYLLYGADAGGPSASAGAEKEERSKDKGSSSQRPRSKKSSSKGDGLFSGSGKEGTKEIRPKSATKKRDGNMSLNNTRSGGSSDPRDELYPKSNEELYPTARGLIRK
jgi:kinesin family protein 3/17